MSICNLMLTSGRYEQVTLNIRTAMKRLDIAQCINKKDRTGF